MCFNLLTFIISSVLSKGFIYFFLLNLAAISPAFKDLDRVGELGGGGGGNYSKKGGGNYFNLSSV